MTAPRFFHAPWIASDNATDMLGSSDDLRLRRSYLERRINGIKGGDVNGLLSYDGVTKWVSECDMGVGEKRSDYYYLQYTEGPEDARRMAEQDRNYVFELEAEGRLDQVEPNLETEVPSLYEEIQVYRKAKIETTPPGRIKKFLVPVETNAITVLDLSVITKEKHLAYFAEVRKQIGPMREDRFVVPDFVPLSTEEIDQIFQVLIQNHSVKIVNFGDVDLSAHTDVIAALIGERSDITIQPPVQTIPAINTIGDFIMPKQDISELIEVIQNNAIEHLDFSEYERDYSKEQIGTFLEDDKKLCLHSSLLLPNGLLATGSFGGSLVRIWNLHTGECIRTLEGPGGYVYALKALPNGLLAVGKSGSEGSTLLQLWDVDNEKIVKTLQGHGSSVTGLDLLPSGQLVSASEDKTVKIWDLETSACVKTLKDHKEAICGLAILPDGRIASGSLDKTIRIWNAQTGECVKTLNSKSSGGIYSLGVLPDGRLVSGGLRPAPGYRPIKAKSGIIEIWDIDGAGNEPVKTLEGHTGSVRSFATLPTGHLVSAGCSCGDKTVRIWDVDSGECIKDFIASKDEAPNGGGGVCDITVLPDGGLVSVGYDAVVRIWDFPILNLQSIMEALERNTSVMEIRGESFVYQAYQKGMLKTDRVSEEYELLRQIEKFAARNCGAMAKKQRLEAEGKNKKGDFIMPKQDVSELIEAIRREEITELNFSEFSSYAMPPKESPQTLIEDIGPIGRLKCSDKYLVGCVHANKTILIWKITSSGFELLRRFESPRPSAAIAILPGDRVAFGENKIYIYDITSGEYLHTLADGIGNGTNSLVVLPDGRLVSGPGAGDQFVRIWDISSGKCERLGGHAHYIQGLTVSPDGKWLASSSWDGSVWIWDVVSKKLLHELEGATRVVAISDALLACSAKNGGPIRIHDVRSGECKMILGGHAGPICEMEISPEGYLVSCSGDKTIKVWDTTTGECLQTLTDVNGIAGHVNALAVLPDGRLIGGSAEDKAVKIWKFPALLKITELQVILEALRENHSVKSINWGVCVVEDEGLKCGIDRMVANKMQERIRQETEEKARQEEKERTNREMEELLERKIQAVVGAERSEIQEAGERLQSTVEEKTSVLEAKFQVIEEKTSVLEARFQQAEEMREREKQEMTGAMESSAQVIREDLGQLKEQITQQQAEVTEKFQSVWQEQQTAAKNLYDRQGEAENKHQLLEGKIDEVLQEVERKRQEGEEKLGIRIQEASRAATTERQEIKEGLERKLEKADEARLTTEEDLSRRIQEVSSSVASDHKDFERTMRQGLQDSETKQQTSTREIQQELQSSRTTFERSLGVHKETLEYQQAALRTELSAPMTFIRDQREYMISNIESAIAQRNIPRLKELLPALPDLRGINLSEAVEQIDGEETFDMEQQIDLRSKGAILTFKNLIEDIEKYLESIETNPEDQPILKKLYHLLKSYVDNHQKGTLQSTAIREDFDQAAVTILAQKYEYDELRGSVREVLNQELQKDKKTNQELWLLDKAPTPIKERFDTTMEAHYLHQLRERNPEDISGYDQIQANIQREFYARYKENQLEEKYTQDIDNTVEMEILEKLTAQGQSKIQPLTSEFNQALAAEATKVEATDEFRGRVLLDRTPIYRTAIANLLKKWRTGELEQETTPEVYAEFKAIIQARLREIKPVNPLREDLTRAGINILIEQVKAGYRARKEQPAQEEQEAQAKSEAQPEEISDQLLDILLEGTNYAIGAIKAKDPEIREGLRKLLTIKRENPERLTEEDHDHIDNLTQERWNHYLAELKPYAYPSLMLGQVQKLTEENQELKEQLAQMQLMMTQLSSQFAQFTGRQETDAAEEQSVPTAQARSGAGMFRKG
jgi:WD40 repeat protein